MKRFVVLVINLLLMSPVFSQQKETKTASLVCPPIVYPKQSKQKEEEGTVQLLIRINKDSTVGDIVVERSSGYGRLDSAAIELIPNCQLIAATRDSIPYDSNVRQRFTFKLEGGTPLNKPIRSEEDRRRIENMRRMAGLASATNDFQTVPYSQRITQRIKPNIVFGEEIQGNPAASVEIKCSEDGKIIGVKLIESSGIRGWDEAVLKAVVRAVSLPLDDAGKAPPTLIIHFRPNE